MKKRILLVFLILIAVFATSCNYNGEATIHVRNIGTLIVTVRVENSYTHLEPGSEDFFDITWPGHGDQRINFHYYPYNHPELSVSQLLTVKDGDYLDFNVEFHPDDL